MSASHMTFKHAALEQMKNMPQLRQLLSLGLIVIVYRLRPDGCIMPFDVNDPDPYHTAQPAQETYPLNALRNNAKGSDLDKEALERFKVREICESWGSYHDAAEQVIDSSIHHSWNESRSIRHLLIHLRWENYRSMFFDDAYIATSWHEGNIDDFIQASKDGSKLMYILHRIIGFSVEINPAMTREVCKQKITITCRFTFDGAEMDNDADCRFFFLLEKREGRWGVVFYTLLFDKDKFVPVNPSKTFHLPEEESCKYPTGYRYLAWAEVRNGTPPKMNLNAHGPQKNVLYGKCRDWLEGRDVRPDLTGADDSDWVA